MAEKTMSEAQTVSFGEKLANSQAFSELFREGMALGTGDHANSVMADVAAELTDEEIQALASYIEGLHPNPVAA